MRFVVHRRTIQRLRTRHEVGLSQPLPRRRARPLELGAVLLAADDAEHDLAEPVDGLGARLAIGVGDARPLVLGQQALELDALLRQLEQTLAAVPLAGALDDEALADKLAEHAA